MDAGTCVFIGLCDHSRSSYLERKLVLSLGVTGAIAGRTRSAGLRNDWKGFLADV